MSEKKAIVNTDDNIDMVETYWLTKLSGLLLVEMMHAILHNIPILKSDSALSLYEKKYQALYYKRKKTTDEKALMAINEKIAVYQDARSKYKKGEISSDEFISMLEE